MPVQWYEISIRDEVAYTPVLDDSEPVELSISVELIDVEDVDTDGLGNPVASVHFIGDDAFVVVSATRPIQALLIAIGLLTPDRRRKRKDVCLI